VTARNSPFVFDPYLIKTLDGLSSAQLYESLIKLYPSTIENTTRKEDLLLLEAWLEKARRLPAVAFSTGRTKSFKGMATCAALDCLGVNLPRGPRTKTELAWAILDSPEGRRKVSDSVELAQARAARPRKKWEWYEAEVIVDDDAACDALLARLSRLRQVTVLLRDGQGQCHTTLVAGLCGSVDPQGQRVVKFQLGPGVFCFLGSLAGPLDLVRRAEEVAAGTQREFLLG